MNKVNFLLYFKNLKLIIFLIDVLLFFTTPEKIVRITLSILQRRPSPLLGSLRMAGTSLPVNVDICQWLESGMHTKDIW